MKILLLLLTFFSTLLPKVTCESRKINDETYDVTLHFDADNTQYIYKDFLDVNVDNHQVTLSKWQSSIDAINQYDPLFKENKKIFNQNFTISLQASSVNQNLPAYIHVNYCCNGSKKIVSQVFPLIEKHVLSTTVDAANSVIVNSEKSDTTLPQSCPVPVQHQKQSWSDYLSSLVKHSQSLAMRLILAFLLGILLSLTPCIYPMIPITVGILQTQARPSLFSNFLISLSYTIGIAITFALLGLLAAFTGQIFGSFMNKPIVIIAIVCLLIYLAFSMFGFYEMYIPKTLRTNNNRPTQGGAYLSAFMFGIMSGSIASPCLSPGLVLLLSIVSTLGSKILGFLLLFFFGIGLGLPLLIVGTFSSSLTHLPRAGMWMVEIKTFFGFVMLGMCFYFITPLISWPLLLLLLGIFLFTAGSYYLYRAQHEASGTGRTIKQVLGFMLIMSSIATFGKAYISLFKPAEETTVWQCLSYDAAFKQAEKEQKKIFMAFSGPFCSICKLIDKTILKDQKVQEMLAHFVAIKLDGSAENPACQLAQEKYAVKGYPTYVLVDPTTGAELKRWGCEIYEQSADHFAQELKNFVKA